MPACGQTVRPRVVIYIHHSFTSSARCQQLASFCPRDLLGVRVQLDGKTIDVWNVYNGTNADDEPRAAYEDAEYENLLSIVDDRRFQIARDRLNSRVDEYRRAYARYERQEQVLADLTLAMKRSADEMHQGTLNSLREGYQVFEYLTRAYAPSEKRRIQEAIRKIDWLEKGDYTQKGIEQWLLAWKDMSQKLVDKGMPIEADRLRQKFQLANKKIRPETETFLMPKSLDENSTLQDMIDACLAFYRLYPPSSTQATHSFASFQGKRQNGSKKSYKCFCEDSLSG